MRHKNSKCVTRIPNVAQEFKIRHKKLRTPNASQILQIRHKNSKCVTNTPYAPYELKMRNKNAKRSIVRARSFLQDAGIQSSSYISIN